MEVWEGLIMMRRPQHHEFQHPGEKKEMIENLERRGGRLVVAIVYYFVVERQKGGNG